MKVDRDAMAAARVDRAIQQGMDKSEFWTEIEPGVLREFVAAYRRASRGATLTLELGGDPKGNVRLRLVGVRGVTCQELERGVEP